MSFEQFQSEQNETLENLFTIEDGQEIDLNKIKSGVTNVINAYLDRSKDTYNTKQGQIKKYEEVLSAIGYDPNKHTNVKDFADSFKQKNEELSQKEMTLEELTLEVKSLRKERDDANKLAEETNRKNTISSIKDTLSKELDKSEKGKFTQKGKERVIKDLLNDGVPKMVGGEIKFDYGGDDVLSLEEGIKRVFSEYDDMLVLDQVSGAGSSKGTKDKSKESSLTLDDFNKMTPEQRKAHKKELHKLMGIKI